MNDNSLALIQSQFIAETRRARFAAVVISRRAPRSVAADRLFPGLRVNFAQLVKIH
jgi:hypothetical protein